jgi:hypothetical protein
VAQLRSCSGKEGRRFEVMRHSTNFGQFWEIFVFDFVLLTVKWKNMGVTAHKSQTTHNQVTMVAMATQV